MKIVVVLANEAQLGSAGVRIRYRRLAPYLEAAGHSFAFYPIDAVERRTEKLGDVVIFSKCHDARAIVIAKAMRALGARLGVDVFDDYYSDPEDARFVHLRTWFGELSYELDFCLCATSSMRDRLASLLPAAPCHVVNDPAPDFDMTAAVGAAERSLERALSSRRIDLCWFGIGDNPHFQLGLNDLGAYSEPLRELARSGFRTRLSILTNRRALDVERLETLARLPVDWRLEEWTEDLEKEIVAASLASFLPVRAQSFSAVKSLNRALTALSLGSQVISTEFPLYRELSPFIYGSAANFLADLKRGEPAFRRETSGTFVELVDRLGRASVEAECLTAFLERVTARPSRPAPLTAVIHGRRSGAPVQKFARRSGCLSVASPLAKQSADHDIRFDTKAVPGEIAIVFSEAAVAALRPEDQAALPPARGKPTRAVAASALRVMPPAGLADMLLSQSLPLAAMRYPKLIGYIMDLVKELYADADVIVSEDESPFHYKRADGHRPSEDRARPS